MTNQVVLVGGESKRSPEGKIGAHFEEFDEATAMARWQQGRFHEIERALAGMWRSTLTNIDFRSMMEWALTTLNIERVGTLDEAKNRVDEFVDTTGWPVVRFAGRFLGVSAEGEELIERRYAETGEIPLREFAPYASYILRVNLFFYVSMASHLIARERPSNFVDIAYLYYVPFCQVFASNDKLHARTAPMFCEQEQQFVDGKDLKAGLREINDFYLTHMEEIEKVGIMRFAQYPPEHLDNTVTQLWDRFMRGWRGAAAAPEAEDERDPENRMTPERLVDIVEKSVPIESTAESEYVMITRKAPIRKGRWRLMPPEVEQR